MTGCTIVCETEQFETAASFPRVPVHGEYIEADPGYEGWPDDAADTKWRIVSIEWALSGGIARPMVLIERA